MTKFLAFAIAILFTCSKVHASVIIDTARLSYNFGQPTQQYNPYSVRPNPFVIQVGSGPQFIVGNIPVEVNFISNGITDEISFNFPSNFSPSYPFQNMQGFNGPVLTLVSGNPFGSLQATQGIDASRVTLTPGYLRLNLAGLNNVGRVSVSVGSAVFGVPEPNIWLMLMLGFGMIGYVKRRPRSFGITC